MKIKNTSTGSRLGLEVYDFVGRFCTMFKPPNLFSVYQAKRNPTFFQVGFPSFIQYINYYIPLYSTLGLALEYILNKNRPNLHPIMFGHAQSVS